MGKLNYSKRTEQNFDNVEVDNFLSQNQKTLEVLFLVVVLVSFIKIISNFKWFLLLFYANKQIFFFKIIVTKFLLLFNTVSLSIRKLYNFAILKILPNSALYFFFYNNNPLKKAECSLYLLVTEDSCSLPIPTHYSYWFGLVQQQSFHFSGIWFLLFFFYFFFSTLGVQY